MNIQKFSVHDGDGIRTTVFFKGCPLSCAWCHNSESCSFEKELMFYQERCTGCGACVSICTEHAASIIDGKSIVNRDNCITCGRCTEACIYNAREVVGEEMEVSELIKALLRDFQFYEISGGGVTLSGGEVMAQELQYILMLMKKLKFYGCNIAVDTCGDVSGERFEAVLPYVDTFLYDIKAITPQIHMEYTGKSNERILTNLKELSKKGAKINIRIPVVPGVNDGEEMDKIICFVKENVNPVKVNLLPYHNIGKDKAHRIGRKLVKEFRTPSKKEMENIQKKWIDEGICNVEIGG